MVALNLKKATDLSKAAVWKFELWRHGDEKKLKRETRSSGLVDMLKRSDHACRRRKDCVSRRSSASAAPASSNRTASIDRGAQNLPGNWESSRFNLPLSLRKAIPKIGEHETAVLLHNDAVVQGLSETPFMSDVKHWGVLTIGTGLGNARFTNRASAGKD